jgi:hypothetical protein
MNSARRSLRAPIALLCAALAVSLVACSGGGDDKKAVKAPAPAGSTLELAAGPVSVDAAGPPGALADADRDAIIAALRKYVVAATIKPMHGKPVGDLAPLFTPTVAAALAAPGPNRATVIDEGMPKATKLVKAVAPAVPLVALSDQTGAINLVGASLVLDVTTQAKGGPVQVQRHGELVFERNANTWKIASYKLTVNRTGAGLETPTTSSTEKSAP